MHLPSVDFSCDLRHVSRVLIASWRGYLRQDRGTAGNHERPGACADQNQSPTAPGVLISKLLCKRPTPGDTQHIDLLVAQLIKHLRHQPGMGRKPVRDAWGR